MGSSFAIESSVRQIPVQSGSEIFGVRDDSAGGCDGTMNMQFFLMAQYDGLAVIPLEDVCRDYFRHLTPEKMLRKVNSGEIKIPIVRMERSQKCAKGVSVIDLADYLEYQRQMGLKEFEQMHGHAPKTTSH